MQSQTYKKPNDRSTEMSSLSACITKAYKDGYINDLKVNDEGQMHTMAEDVFYKPEEVKIINFYRFEGESDPADNVIMYTIETNDGVKGILIDAYGAYADEETNKFIADVQEMNKKTDGNGARTASDTTALE